MSRKREEGKGAIEDVRAGWYVWWEGQAYKVKWCDLRHGIRDGAGGGGDGPASGGGR